MLNFSLRQIEFALAALDLGTLAAAAAACGATQPSVSSAIRKLEQHLGIQLFIRHHAKGISPTPQGARFLADARSLMSQAKDLQQSAVVEGKGIAGTLHVGSYVTLAAMFAPRLIKGFQQTWPTARLHFHEGVQESLLDDLRHGRSDCALIYNVNLPNDIVATDVAHLKPYVLLPAKHPLSNRKSISLKRLRDEPLVLLDIQPSRTYFLRLLEQAGVQPQSAFSTSSLELLRGLVGQGLGYSILVSRPRGDATYDGEKLRALPISDTVEHAVVSVARLKRSRPIQLLRTFETYCSSAFKQFDSRTMSQKDSQKMQN